jgi:hypothetical protein
MVAYLAYAPILLQMWIYPNNLTHGLFPGVILLLNPKRPTDN